MSYKFILSPVAIPDKLIYRKNKNGEEYNLTISAETIKKYKERFERNPNFRTLVTLDHTKKPEEGIYISKSYILDEENRKGLIKQFKHLPDGTWMMEFTVATKELWDKIEAAGYKGISLEGMFSLKDEDGNIHPSYEEFKKMTRLSDLSAFHIKINGGSTDGRGRNEHGAPHFHLVEKNSDQEIGKFELPSIDLWKTANPKNQVELIKLIEGTDINKKQKLEIVSWFNKNGNEKLVECHAQWLENNKDNHRIH